MVYRSYVLRGMFIGQVSGFMMDLFAPIETIVNKCESGRTDAVFDEMKQEPVFGRHRSSNETM